MDTVKRLIEAGIPFWFDGSQVALTVADVPSAENLIERLGRAAGLQTKGVPLTMAAVEFSGWGFMDEMGQGRLANQTALDSKGVGSVLRTLMKYIDRNKHSVSRGFLNDVDNQLKKAGY